MTIDKDALETLVRRAKGGEPEALSALIAATKTRVYRFCLMLCHEPALAQDLAQDTYVRALDELSRLKDPSKFTSWLHRIARNLFLDHIKSPASRVVEPASEDTPAGDDPEFSLHLRQTLQKLEPEDRLLLLLVDLEEYSYKEAAEIIGISESNVKFRLHHIRKKFMAKYGK